MKILVFSDLHAHPFKEGHTEEDGINTRLKDCISVLDKVHALAIENGVDLILFGGDLFHTRKRVDTSAFTQVYAVLEEWTIPAYFLVGNHDQYDRQGRVHSLQALPTNISVVDEPTVHLQADFTPVNVLTGADPAGKPPTVQICMIPYIHDTAEFVKALDECKAQVSEYAEYVLLLAHVGIDGTKVGKGKYAYTIDSDVAIGDIEPELWDVVLLGHYHTAQSIAENVFYIGAPLQHGWADEGESRGCMLLDTDTREISRIRLDSPRFRTLSWDKKHKRSKGDFLRLVFPTEPTQEDIDEVKSWGDEYGGVTMTVKPQKVIVDRAGINLASSRKEMLASYVELADTEELALDVLLNTGLQYLGD